jgi:hypothetical protein
MTLRRFLLPDARWDAPRGQWTVVDLTRPGFGRVGTPTAVGLAASVFTLVSARSLIDPDFVDADVGVRSPAPCWPQYSWSQPGVTCGDSWGYAVRPAPSSP